MKKILLSLGLLLFVFGGMTAQGEYTYLKGQASPFNGEFNEPRYIDVDSITYVISENKIFVDPSSAEFLESTGDFVETNVGYTLIKSSYDGFVDTLNIFSETHLTGIGKRYHVKKYSDEGRLVYSSSVMEYPSMTDREEREYLYDVEGRILEIATTKNHDGAATVMVYDTVKYDYEFKPYLSTVTIKYNTIYTKEDSILVFYFDDKNVCATIEYAGTVYEVNTEYLFDNQSRLTKITKSFYSPAVPTGNNSEEPNDLEFKEPITIEYKYTDNGYEEYENAIKKTEYKFQDDGYCMEIIQYEPLDAAVFPPVYSVKSIRKFSYFKDGEVIVDNGLIGKTAPEVYGIQGGVAINTEKSLPVSIYTFSGSLVKQERVSAGTNTIPLTKGLYVVVVGNMSYKVLVR